MPCPFRVSTFWICRWRNVSTILMCAILRQVPGVGRWNWFILKVHFLVGKTGRSISTSSTDVGVPQNPPDTLENMEIHTIYVTWWLVSNKLSIRTCIDDCGPHQTSGEQLFSLSLRWKIANMAGSMGTFTVEQLGIFQHVPPKMSPRYLPGEACPVGYIRCVKPHGPGVRPDSRECRAFKMAAFYGDRSWYIPLNIGDINIDQYMGKSNMVNPILINIWHYSRVSLEKSATYDDIHQYSSVIHHYLSFSIPGITRSYWCYWCPDLSDCPIWCYGNPSFEGAQTMIALGDWC